MAAAMYYYTEAQPNYVEVNSGEPVIVGPVQYTITFDGTNSGNKETQPENTFVKIRIEVENISQETTEISGGQFQLIDGYQKFKAVYGGFSEKDLYVETLEPGESASWTTQFDVPYDEQKQFDLVIRPTKEQSSLDIVKICLTNC